MADVTVRAATRPDRKVAAQSLASAFSTDPLFMWMTGPTDRMESRIYHLFKSELSVETRKDAHLTFVADDGGGAAIWKGIDQWKTSTLQMLPALPALVRSLGSGLLRGRAVAEQMERDHPSEPHYYLEVLGTRKDRQGEGLGSALIQPMLERCDGEGVPAYLENSNPRNTPFYARHGFADRGLIDLPEGAPPFQAMWRDPR